VPSTGGKGFSTRHSNATGGATISNVTWTNNVDSGTGNACN